MQQAVPTSKLPPNRPPTSVLLVLKMKFFEHIRFILKQIAKAASFGIRRLMVYPAFENGAALLYCLLFKSSRTEFFVLRLLE